MSQGFLIRSLSLLCLMAGVSWASSAPSEVRANSQPENAPVQFQQWDRNELMRDPATHAVSDAALSIPEFPEGTIAPIFFDGMPDKGRPTRVFAWVGIPAGASRETPVPGIVLVHGGGGTAFPDWVKLWVQRGYAAVALDTNGNIPISAEQNAKQGVQRHEWSGPCANDSFSDGSKPPSEQGPFHAVGAIVRAHSLLRSLPGVDAEKTGITGISWGGIWTELAAAVDPRFKFVVPVYGCGYLGENSEWRDKVFPQTDSDALSKWLSLWDPSHFIQSIKAPVLFVNGTNDIYFRFDSWQKSTALAVGPTIRSLQVRMPHGHPPEGDPKEVRVFADSVVMGGTPLPTVTESGIRDNRARIKWTDSAGAPVTSVKLIYTTDSGPWPERRWRDFPVPLGGGNARTREAETEIPEGATALYFNLGDSRGCIVSSGHLDAVSPEDQ